MIFAGIVVAAAVVSVSAQDLSGLSPSCQTAVAGVLTGPASECLAVPGIVDVVMAPKNESLIGPINNWLTSVCTRPACTNATIKATVSSIGTGCETDLGRSGIGNDFISSREDDLVYWYPTGREIACLKETSKDDYCVTSTLKAYEKWVGVPFSIDGLRAYQTKLITTVIPYGLVCTPCIQGAYALVYPHLDESNKESWSEWFGVCGSSFVDGSLPAGIKQTANTATAGTTTNSNGTNGAMSMSSSLKSATLLVGVAGLAVLAL